MRLICFCFFLLIFDLNAKPCSIALGDILSDFPEGSFIINGPDNQSFKIRIENNEWHVESTNPKDSALPVKEISEAEVEKIQKELCKNASTLKKNPQARKLAEKIMGNEKLKSATRNLFLKKCNVAQLGYGLSFPAWLATSTTRHYIPESKNYLNHVSNPMITLVLASSIHLCASKMGISKWNSLLAAELAGAGTNIGLEYYGAKYLDEEIDYTDLNAGLSAALSYAAIGSILNLTTPSAVSAFCK